jgi:aspartyl-tRNA(Asn)/glutamyl-tRNA(Gln) amidotransferase subunit C
MISRDDIYNLADLARLSVNEEQVTKYEQAFEGIVRYIDTLKEVEVSDTQAQQVVTNVVREDDESYEPGSFTEDLLHEAPQQHEGYIKVRKIL